MLLVKLVYTDLKLSNIKMLNYHFYSNVYVSWLVASFEFFLAEFSVSYTEVLAAAPEGFAVVVGVGARTDPIHPIGVRLDLNLAILTAMESQ